MLSAGLRCKIRRRQDGDRWLGEEVEGGCQCVVRCGKPTAGWPWGKDRHLESATNGKVEAVSIREGIE
eukprot:1703348-Prorocentrum_lima.AAC.1